MNNQNNNIMTIITQLNGKKLCPKSFTNFHKFAKKIIPVIRG